MSGDTDRLDTLPNDELVAKVREIEEWHRRGADFCSNTNAIERHEGYAAALSVLAGRLQDAQTLAEAADRLSFEVQYFDEHPPELCAMKRAALYLDGRLAAFGIEIQREGADVPTRFEGHGKYDAKTGSYYCDTCKSVGYGPAPARFAAVPPNQAEEERRGDD